MWITYSALEGGLSSPSGRGEALRDPKHVKEMIHYTLVVKTINLTHIPRDLALDVEAPSSSLQ